MKKRYLFIMRHAHYDAKIIDGDLLDKKDVAVVKSASEIKEKIGCKENILIISSTAKRCIQTADIVSEIIPNAKREENPIFNPSSNTKDDQLVDFIFAKTEDVIIIVTHEEMSNIFPYKLMKRAGLVKSFEPLFFGKFHFLELSF